VVLHRRHPRHRIESPRPINLNRFTLVGPKLARRAIRRDTMALHPSVTQRKQRERNDGGILDAEIIRPRSWILARGLCAGRMLPFNSTECLAPI